MHLLTNEIHSKHCMSCMSCSLKIDLSAMVHHRSLVDFVLIHGMHYSGKKTKMTINTSFVDLTAKYVFIL